mgnify:CR=1 FL=1
MTSFSIDLINLLRKQKFLPIINSKEIEEDIRKIDSLLKKNNSIKCIEVTLREERSFDNAIALKEKFPFIYFGLGSILNIEMYNQYSSNKFDFYVSPGLIPEIISLNLKNYIPGAETISEFNTLQNFNFKLVKFFPASLSGGAEKLISIQNIYKKLNFIPTGGINKNNMNNYLQLKNVVCVGMSNFE